MLAAAQARGAGIECGAAGFLSYEDVGEAPDAVYSRNALHHLLDVWKAVALRRAADLLKPGGTLVLRDVVYSCDPVELEHVLEAWSEAAPAEPREGRTRVELEAHVRDEYSTFTWLLEPMLQGNGFEIQEAWYSDSRTYAPLRLASTPSSSSTSAWSSSSTSLTTRRPAPSVTALLRFYDRRLAFDISSARR